MTYIYIYNYATTHWTRNQSHPWLFVWECPFIQQLPSNFGRFLSFVQGTRLRSAGSAWAGKRDMFWFFCTRTTHRYTQILVRFFFKLRYTIYKRVAAKSQHKWIDLFEQVNICLNNQWVTFFRGPLIWRHVPMSIWLKKKNTVISHVHHVHLIGVV